MNPGEVLRELRISRRISQQALAEQVGMSVATISQWERGIITPRRGAAQRADRALGADGRILATFGYPADTDTADDVLTRLGETVDRQGRQLEALAELVAELTAAVAELRRS